LTKDEQILVAAGKRKHLAAAEGREVREAVFVLPLTKDRQILVAFWEGKQLLAAVEGREVVEAAVCFGHCPFLRLIS
jgi:hypothetical protein